MLDYVIRKNLVENDIDIQYVIIENTFNYYECDLLYIMNFQRVSLPPPQDVQGGTKQNESRKNYVWHCGKVQGYNRSFFKC